MDEELKTPLGNVPDSTPPGQRNISAGVGDFGIGAAVDAELSDPIDMNNIVDQYSAISSNFTDLTQRAAEHVGDIQTANIGNDFGATNPYMYNTYYEPAATEFGAAMRQQGTQIALEAGLTDAQKKAEEALKNAQNRYSQAYQQAQQQQQQNSDGLNVVQSETWLEKKPEGVSDEEWLSWATLSDDELASKLESKAIDLVDDGISIEDWNNKNYRKYGTNAAKQYLVNKGEASSIEDAARLLKENPDLWNRQDIGNAWTIGYLRNYYGDGLIGRTIETNLANAKKTADDLIAYRAGEISKDQISELQLAKIDKTLFTSEKISAPEGWDGFWETAKDTFLGGSGVDPKIEYVADSEVKEYIDALSEDYNEGLQREALQNAADSKAFGYLEGVNVDELSALEVSRLLGRVSKNLHDFNEGRLDRESEAYRRFSEMDTREYERITNNLLSGAYKEDFINSVDKVVTGDVDQEFIDKYSKVKMHGSRIAELSDSENLYDAMVKFNDVMSERFNDKEADEVDDLKFHTIRYDYVPMDDAMQTALGVDEDSWDALVQLKKDDPDYYNYLQNRTILTYTENPLEVVSDPNKLYYSNGEWKKLDVGTIVMNTPSDMRIMGDDGEYKKNDSGEYIYKDEALNNLVADLKSASYKQDGTMADEDMEKVNKDILEYMGHLNMYRAFAGTYDVGGAKDEDLMNAVLMFAGADANNQNLLVTNIGGDKVTYQGLMDWFNGMSEDDRYIVYSALMQRAAESRGFYMRQTSEGALFWKKDTGYSAMSDTDANGNNVFGAYHSADEEKWYNMARENLNDQQALGLLLLVQNQMQKGGIKTEFLDNDHINEFEHYGSATIEAATDMAGLVGNLFYIMSQNAQVLGHELIGDKEGQNEHLKNIRDAWHDQTTLDEKDDWLGGDTTFLNKYTRETRNNQRAALNNAVSVLFNPEYFDFVNNTFDESTGEWKDKNGNVITYSDNIVFHKDDAKAFAYGATELAGGITEFVAENIVIALLTGGLGNIPTVFATLAGKNGAKATAKLLLFGSVDDMARKGVAKSTTVTFSTKSKKVAALFQTADKVHDASVIAKTAGEAVEHADDIAKAAKAGSKAADVLYGPSVVKETAEQLAESTTKTAAKTAEKAAEKTAKNVAKEYKAIINADETVTLIDEFGREATTTLSELSKTSKNIKNALTSAAATQKESIEIFNQISELALKQIDDASNIAMDTAGNISKVDKAAKQVAKKVSSAAVLGNAAYHSDAAVSKAAQKIANKIMTSNAAEVKKAMDFFGVSESAVKKAITEKVQDAIVSSLRKQSILNTFEGVTKEALDNASDKILKQLTTTARSKNFGTNAAKRLQFGKDANFLDIIKAAFGDDTKKGAELINDLLKKSASDPIFGTTEDILQEIYKAAPRDAAKANAIDRLATNAKVLDFVADRATDIGRDVLQNYASPYLDEEGNSRITTIEEYFDIIHHPENLGQGVVFDMGITLLKGAAGFGKTKITQAKLTKASAAISDAIAKGDTDRIVKASAAMNKQRATLKKLASDRAGGGWQFKASDLRKVEAATEQLDAKMKDVFDMFDSKDLAVPSMKEFAEYKNAVSTNNKVAEGIANKEYRSLIGRAKAKKQIKSITDLNAYLRTKLSTSALQMANMQDLAVVKCQNNAARIINAWGLNNKNPENAQLMAIDGRSWGKTWAKSSKDYMAISQTNRLKNLSRNGTIARIVKDEFGGSPALLKEINDHIASGDANINAPKLSKKARKVMFRATAEDFYNNYFMPNIATLTGAKDVNGINSSIRNGMRGFTESMISQGYGFIDEGRPVRADYFPSQGVLASDEFDIDNLATAGSLYNDQDHKMVSSIIANDKEQRDSITTQKVVDAMLAGRDVVEYTDQFGNKQVKKLNMDGFRPYLAEAFSYNNRISREIRNRILDPATYGTVVVSDAANGGNRRKIAENRKAVFDEIERNRDAIEKKFAMQQTLNDELARGSNDVSEKTKKAVSQHKNDVKTLRENTPADIEKILNADGKTAKLEKAAKEATHKAETVSAEKLRSDLMNIQGMDREIEFYRTLHPELKDASDIDVVNAMADTYADKYFKATGKKKPESKNTNYAGLNTIILTRDENGHYPILSAILKGADNNTKLDTEYTPSSRKTAKKLTPLDLSKSRHIDNESDSYFVKNMMYMLLKQKFFPGESDNSLKAKTIKNQINNEFTSFKNSLLDGEFDDGKGAYGSRYNLSQFIEYANTNMSKLMEFIDSDNYKNIANEYGQTARLLSNMESQGYTSINDVISDLEKRIDSGNYTDDDLAALQAAKALKDNTPYNETITFREIANEDSDNSSLDLAREESSTESGLVEDTPDSEADIASTSYSAMKNVGRTFDDSTNLKELVNNGNAAQEIDLTEGLAISTDSVLQHARNAAKDVVGESFGAEFDEEVINQLIKAGKNAGIEFSETVSKYPDAMAKDIAYKLNNLNSEEADQLITKTAPSTKTFDNKTAFEALNKYLLGQKNPATLYNKLLENEKVANNIRLLAKDLGMEDYNTASPKTLASRLGIFDGSSMDIIKNATKSESQKRTIAAKLNGSKNEKNGEVIVTKKATKKASKSKKSNNATFTEADIAAIRNAINVDPYSDALNSEKRLIETIKKSSAYKKADRRGKTALTNKAKKIAKAFAQALSDNPEYQKTKKYNPIQSESVKNRIFGFFDAEAQKSESNSNYMINVPNYENTLSAERNASKRANSLNRKLDNQSDNVFESELERADALYNSTNDISTDHFSFEERAAEISEDPDFSPAEEAFDWEVYNKAYTQLKSYEPGKTSFDSGVKNVNKDLIQLKKDLDSAVDARNKSAEHQVKVNQELFEKFVELKSNNVFSDKELKELFGEEKFKEFNKKTAKKDLKKPKDATDAIIDSRKEEVDLLMELNQLNAEIEADEERFKALKERSRLLDEYEANTTPFSASKNGYITVGSSDAIDTRGLISLAEARSMYTETKKSTLPDKRKLGKNKFKEVSGKEGAVKKRSKAEVASHKAWLDEVYRRINADYEGIDLEEENIYISPMFASLGNYLRPSIAEEYDSKHPKGKAAKIAGKAGDAIHKGFDLITNFNSWVQDKQLAAGLAQYNAFTFRNAATMILQHPIRGLQTVVTAFKNSNDCESVLTFYTKNADKLTDYSIRSGDFEGITAFSSTDAFTWNPDKRSNVFKATASDIKSQIIKNQKLRNKVTGSLNSIIENVFDNPTFGRWMVIARADMSMRNYDAALRFARGMNADDSAFIDFGTDDIEENGDGTSYGMTNGRRNFAATLARAQTEYFFDPKSMISLKNKNDSEKALIKRDNKKVIDFQMAQAGYPKPKTFAQVASNFFFAINYKLQMGSHPFVGAASILTSLFEPLNAARSTYIGSRAIGITRNQMGKVLSRRAANGLRNEAASIIGICLAAYAWNEYIGAPQADSDLNGGLIGLLCNMQDAGKFYIPNGDTSNGLRGSYDASKSSYSIDPLFSIFTLPNSINRTIAKSTGLKKVNTNWQYGTPLMQGLSKALGVSSSDVNNNPVARTIRAVNEEIIGANLISMYGATWEVLTNNTYFGNNIWERKYMPDGSLNPNYNPFRNVAASVAHLLNMDTALDSSGSNAWVKGLSQRNASPKNSSSMGWLGKAIKDSGAYGDEGVQQDRTGTVSGSGLLQHEYYSGAGSIGEGDWFGALGSILELPLKSRNYQGRARTALNNDVQLELRELKKQYDQKVKDAGDNQEAKDAAYEEFAKGAVSAINDWANTYDSAIANNAQMLKSATLMCMGMLSGEYDDELNYRQNVYWKIRKDLRLADGDSLLYNDSALNEAIANGMSTDEAAALYNKHHDEYIHALNDEYKAREALDKAGIKDVTGIDLWSEDGSEDLEYRFKNREARRNIISEKVITSIKQQLEQPVGDFKNYKEMQAYYQTLIDEATSTKSKAKIANQYNDYVKDVLAPYVEEYGETVLTDTYWDKENLSKAISDYIIIPADKTYRGKSPKSSYLRDEFGVGWRNSSNITSDDNVVKGIEAISKAMQSGSLASASALSQRVYAMVNNGQAYISDADREKLTRLRALLNAKTK